MGGGQRADVLAEIARGIADLHAHHYGKGPEKANAYALNDAILVLLEGGFTTVERTLTAEGDHEAVYTMRRAFQRAMEGEFRLVVERATQRKVITCMGQIHADPDLVVELFVLDSNRPAEASRGADRAEHAIPQGG